MSEHTEPLSGGLVTSKNPADLQLGELTQAQNTVFRSNSAYPMGFEGHATAATVTGTEPVLGLQALKFDNGDEFLLAHASSLYLTGVLGATPTFASIASGVASAALLHAIHHRNEWAVANGTAAPSAVYLSATAPGTNPSIRTLGLAAVSGTPGVASGTGGTWPLGSVTGWFEFWTTEVQTFTVDGVEYKVESTFDGDPASIQVTAADTEVTITAPDVVNSEADHWKIYRSSAKEQRTDTKFPVGWLVGTVPTGQATWTFGASTNSTAAATATASNLGWSNPLNASASDNAYATITNLGVPFAGGTVVYRDFGFSGLDDPISGIEVLVEAKQLVSGPARTTLTIALSWDDGTTWTAPKTVVTTGTETQVTVGGNGDDWGHVWTADQLTDDNFQVRMSGRISSGHGATGTLSVDYVRVGIYSNGGADASEEGVTVFPAIVLSVDGIDESVGSHGQPPTFSVGDIHEGMLVTDDVDDPLLIKWSLPDQIDYFPVPYYLRIQSQENDQITMIQSINNVVVVGTLTSKHRLNYLPHESDARFTRGRGVDTYDPQHGVVSKKAFCKITTPTGRAALVTVAFEGVFVTDGFTSVDWTEEFDWAALRASIGDLTTAITQVTNDPSEREVAIHYEEGGVPKSLRLNYHPRHIRGNRPKITGPCIESTGASGEDFDVQSALTVADDSGTVYRFIGTDDGVLRKAPMGGADTFQSMILGTRRLYLAGKGQEWQAIDGYLFGEVGANQTSIQGASLWTNKAGTSYGSHTFPLFPLAKVGLNEAYEGAIFTLTTSVTAQHTPKLGELILRGEGFGQEDSGA